MVTIPVTLLYCAVCTPKAVPVVPTPTIDVREPFESITGLTIAGVNLAYPSPFEDPIDIGTPPLGSWFIFTSESDIAKDPSDDVIPVNTTLDIPAFSIIWKLLSGLLSVVGVWKTPFMNKIPLPPLVPIPVVFAPPTVNVNVVVIPLKLLETSS